MEEKKGKKISLSVILLILAIIALVVMGIFMYKLNNEKNIEIKKSTELQAKVDDLNNIVSDLQGKIDKVSETLSTNNSNSIQENTTNSAVKENNYDDIVLDGYYTFPATDIGWDFTKDGRVAFSGSVSSIQGTYKTTGKNSIEAHYTKKIVWEDEPGKVTVSDIDNYETIIVEDDGSVFRINENGQREKLQRDGDAREDSFELN